MPVRDFGKATKWAKSVIFFRKNCGISCIESSCDTLAWIYGLIDFHIVLSSWMNVTAMSLQNIDTTNASRLWAFRLSELHIGIVQLIFVCIYRIRFYTHHKIKALWNMNRVYNWTFFQYHAYFDAQTQTHTLVWNWSWQLFAEIRKMPEKKGNIINCEHVASHFARERQQSNNKINRCWLFSANMCHFSRFLCYPRRMLFSRSKKKTKWKTRAHIVSRCTLIKWHIRCCSNMQT